MNKLAIYGASGHGKVLMEIAKLNGYDDIIFIDDRETKYVSFVDFLSQDISIPMALGIGDNDRREKLYDKCIDLGIEIITLIHPSAVLSSGIVIGEGTVVMANAVINVDTKIGKCCIINTASIVEHDNNIDDFVHVSPNVGCAGNVSIGKNTHIGIGSCITQGVTIGMKSIIGAGSVVLKDIDQGILAYGNPCKIIKEIRS